MNLRRIVAVIAVPLWALCMGLHLATAPDGDQLHSVMVEPETNDRLALQAACYSACQPGGNRVVDLGGRVWVVPRIIWSHVHNGIILRNGEIYSPADRSRYGVIELCKGVSWQGTWYPVGPVNVTLENVTFTGPLSGYTDDFLVNHQRCREQGAFASAVLAIDGSQIDSVTIRNCRVRNLFGGFTLGYTKNARVYDCQFERVAAQCVSALVAADDRELRLIDVYRCKSADCGSLFDFSGYTPDATPPKVPLAKVRQCTATNTLGRTKVHAIFDLLIERCTFRLTRPIPQRYSALNFPGGRTINITGCVLEHYPAGGISSDGWIERPFIDIRDTVIKGGQMGVNSTATYHLANVRFENVLYNYGSPPASQYDTVTVNPASVDSVANKFRGLQAIVRDWNTLHGTTYDPDRFWWISNEVRNRMQQMEAN